MGFNLRMFFDELLEILDDESTDEVDKLDKLDACIIDARQYAIECGEITEEIK